MELTLQKSNNNSLPLAKGIIVAMWGVMALILPKSAPMLLVTSFGILNIAAAFITFLFTYKNRHLQIAHQWLQLEGFIELVAGIVFTFFVSDLQLFMQYMGYGIIFIITLQFIYGYAILMTGKINISNMVMRFLTVFAGVIVSVSLVTGVLNPVAAFIVIGIFSIIYGILNIQFALGFKNAVLGKVQ